jgi:hypothetical protein
MRLEVMQLHVAGVREDSLSFNLVARSGFVLYTALSRQCVWARSRFTVVAGGATPRISQLQKTGIKCILKLLWRIAPFRCKYINGH